MRFKSLALLTGAALSALPGCAGTPLHTSQKPFELEGQQVRGFHLGPHQEKRATYLAAAQAGLLQMQLQEDGSFTYEGTFAVVENQRKLRDSLERVVQNADTNGDTAITRGELRLEEKRVYAALPLPKGSPWPQAFEGVNGRYQIEENDTFPDTLFMSDKPGGPEGNTTIKVTRNQGRLIALAGVYAGTVKVTSDSDDLFPDRANRTGRYSPHTHPHAFFMVLEELDQDRDHNITLDELSEGEERIMRHYLTRIN